MEKDTVKKNLSRIPRVLTERYNAPLLEKLYHLGGSVMVDIIVFLSKHQMKDLFGDVWFSIDDFCETMGYERTNLQRKLTEDELQNIFGKERPIFTKSEGEIDIIKHPIENIFEAALFKLGKENIALPFSKKDGSTSFTFVQILLQFDINDDFFTKKKTKRRYCAKLNNQLLYSLFNNYNLIELQDYKKIPDRNGYRFFYMNLSQMIVLVKYKKSHGEAPHFTLTVDELAVIFGVNIAVNKDRKKKVKTILTTINNLLEVTKFQFSFIKGEKDKWAYTVKFFFPDETLNYFDERFKAVFSKRFHSALEFLYCAVVLSLKASDISNALIEIKNNTEKLKMLQDWIHSDENKEDKEVVYRETFHTTFGKLPEDMGFDNIPLEF